MDQPVWMAEAWPRLGVREVPGAGHSQDVLDFFRDAGHGSVTRDEVPWCAAFVGACLERAGTTATGSLLARSYLKWGDALERPRLGAVVVLSRGQDPGAGHVGFWVGETADTHILIGGNQSDAVTVDAFAKGRVLGFRWPSEAGVTRQTGSAGSPIAPSSGVGLAFDKALVHVLEMEGGFTDDPDDPGGPTNKGIILEVFCRHTGRPLNGSTRAQRVSELRQIPDGMVEEIYRARYWTPSLAGEMPAAIAFMHFDATVNQGVTGAARLLQEAVAWQDPDVEIDGEVGPLTLVAVERADAHRLLADYADVRRAKYRSLGHFWKFGRGWLNRVERTEMRAQDLLPSDTNTTANHDTMKGHDMAINDAMTSGTKWWGSSMTIWGAAITALSTVVPILGPALGLDVTPDVVRQAGEQFIAVVQAVGGLMGTIMTIYGRTRATQLLERRPVQVHI